MTRRLKFYGWGYEGEGFTDAERDQLMSFVAGRLGAEPRPAAAPPLESEIALKASRLRPPASLAGIMTAEPHERLLHTYGKSFPETVRAFARDFANAPDVVAYPRDEGEIAAVMDWAGARGRLVGAVRRRLVASSAASTRGPRGAPGGHARLAQPRPGARGRRDRARRAHRGRRRAGPALEAQLGRTASTLRHFPQSFEYSTLGGWIATRSGGHFASLYTHIDDFVESLRVVTPAGVMEIAPPAGLRRRAEPRPHVHRLRGRARRHRRGLDAAAGAADASAPARACAFPIFFAAAGAVRAISQAGLYPANCRILDRRGLQHRRGRRRGGDHGAGVRIRRSSARRLDGSARSNAAPTTAGAGTRSEDARRGGLWRNAFIRMPYARELTAPGPHRRHVRDLDHLGAVRGVARPP